VNKREAPCESKEWFTLKKASKTFGKNLAWQVNKAARVLESETIASHIFLNFLINLLQDFHCSFVKM